MLIVSILPGLALEDTVMTLIYTPSDCAIVGYCTIAV